MRSTKLFAMAVVAAGVVVSSSVAKAEEPYWDRRDTRQDRDLRHDYAKADRMRRDIARDEYRRDEDLRCERLEAAERKSRHIAHDRHELREQLRDIRRDESDRYWDRRDR